MDKKVKKHRNRLLIILAKCLVRDVIDPIATEYHQETNELEEAYTKTEELLDKLHKDFGKKLNDSTLTTELSWAQSVIQQKYPLKSILDKVRLDSSGNWLPKHRCPQHLTDQEITFLTIQLYNLREYFIYLQVTTEKESLKKQKRITLIQDITISLSDYLATLEHLNCLYSNANLNALNIKTTSPFGFDNEYLAEIRERLVPPITTDPIFLLVNKSIKLPAIN